MTSYLTGGNCPSYPKMISDSKRLVYTLGVSRVIEFSTSNSSVYTLNFLKVYSILLFSSSDPPPGPPGPPGPPPP